MLKERFSAEEKKTTVDNIIGEALKNLKEIVDVNTVIGDEFLTADGTTIIPISKICCGFVAGGGEYESENKKKTSKCYPFAGGSGAGFTVVPVGFLTGKEGNLNFVSTKGDSYDDLLNLTNKTLKLILDNFLNSKNTEKENVKKKWEKQQY